MMWKRSRWSMGVIARDPRHASCRSMRVHRKHECKDPARVAGSIVDCADIATSQGVVSAHAFYHPGRGNSLRNCPVRVRTPAKAPAEVTGVNATRSGSNVCRKGNDATVGLFITGTVTVQRPLPHPTCEYDVNAATRPLPYWGGVERWSRRRPAPQWPERNRLSSIVSATWLRLPKVGCVIRRNAGSNPVEARWAQWPHAKRWVRTGDSLRSAA